MRRWLERTGSLTTAVRHCFSLRKDGRINPVEIKGALNVYNTSDVEDTDLHFFLTSHPIPPQISSAVSRATRRRSNSPPHVVFLLGKWELVDDRQPLARMILSSTRSSAVEHHDGVDGEQERDAPDFAEEMIKGGPPQRLAMLRMLVLVGHVPKPQSVFWIDATTVHNRRMTVRCGPLVVPIVARQRDVNEDGEHMCSLEQAVTASLTKTRSHVSSELHSAKKHKKSSNSHSSNMSFAPDADTVLVNASRSITVTRRTAVHPRGSSISAGEEEANSATASDDGGTSLQPVPKLPVEAEMPKPLRSSWHSQLLSKLGTLPSAAASLEVPPPAVGAKEASRPSHPPSAHYPPLPAAIQKLCLSRVSHTHEPLQERPKKKKKKKASSKKCVYQTLPASGACREAQPTLNKGRLAGSLAILEGPPVSSSGVDDVSVICMQHQQGTNRDEGDEEEMLTMRWRRESTGDVVEDLDAVGSADDATLAAECPHMSDVLVSERSETILQQPSASSLSALEVSKKYSYFLPTGIEAAGSASQVSDRKTLSDGSPSASNVAIRPSLTLQRSETVSVTAEAVTDVPALPDAVAHLLRQLEVQRIERKKVLITPGKTVDEEIVFFEDEIEVCCDHPAMVAWRKHVRVLYDLRLEWYGPQGIVHAGPDTCVSPLMHPRSVLK
jgi:hypothetical protein